MTYSVDFINPDSGKSSENIQFPSTTADLLNYGLRVRRCALLGAWNQNRARGLEPPLAWIITHMMKEPTLYDTENVKAGEYADAVLLAVRLWHACRLYPDYRLSINF